MRLFKNMDQVHGVEDMKSDTESEMKFWKKRR